MNYIAKHKEKETKPGCWNYLDVAIFEVADDGTEKQVGSYERKYSSMYDTFFPFKQKGKWYALYSSDYTATSVMSLPDCKQIATEASSAWGFCPTGFYVPNADDFRHWDSVRLNGGKKRSEDDAYWAELAISLKAHEKEGSNFNAAEDAKKKRQWAVEAEEAYDDIENKYEGQFGFISGCHWGDDSSWKMQYLDLSKITEGVITRTARWGYWELPEGKSLKECLNFEEIELPSFTQCKALKSGTISLMDRNFHNRNIGDVYWFNDDSPFNGMRIKIKEMDDDGFSCEIIYSNNKVKETEIYLEDRFFSYAKKGKPETKTEVFWRKLKYLFKGVV